MKFKIHVTTEDDATGEKAWWETYEEETDDPKRWGEGIIEYFNSSLRPHEKPRKFLGVEVIDDHSIKEHKWVKISAATQLERGRNFDRMECERCGVTGKRFGLQGSTTIDSKFRRVAFKRCDTSLEFIQKNGFPE